MTVERSYRLLSIGLVLACVVVSTLLLLRMGGPAFRLDDAYIVLNNADALFRKDTAFPNAPPLLGSTSLIHTLFVAALGRVVPPELALWMISWAALIALGLGVLTDARSRDIQPLVGALAAVTTMIAGDVLQVTLAGLETGLMMAAIVWIVHLNATGRHPFALAFLLGAAPFIRPELSILSALVGFSAMTSRTMTLRTKATGVAIAVALLVLLLTLQVALSGSVLPQTGEAKTYFFEPVLIPRDQILAEGLAALLVFSLSAGPIVFGGLFARDQSTVLAALFALTAVVLITVSYTAILSQTFYRYFYFLIPVGAMSLLAFGQRGRVQVVLAALVFLTSFTIVGAGLANSWSEKTQTISAKRAELSAAAAWIDAHADKSTPLLTHDIGFAAYFSDQPLFDIVGLRTQASIGINKALHRGNGPEGLADTLIEMMRVSGSCQVLFSRGWDRSGRLSDPLRARGYTFTPSPEGHPPGYSYWTLNGPTGSPCG